MAKISRRPARPALPTRRSGRAAPPHDGRASFEAEASQVLRRLQEAVTDLLNRAVGERPGAAGLQEALGLDRKLSWQVQRVAAAPSPLAAGAYVPTPAGARRFLAAAAQRPGAGAAAARAGAAFEAFERFTADYAGDRQALEVMLAGYVPDIRERTELASREAAFRAAGEIRGVTCESSVVAALLWPAEDGVSVHRASLMADSGLRRLRPGARLGFATMSVPRPDAQPLTLAGEPITSPAAGLLEEFCSSAPAFETRVHDGVTSYWVRGDDVGLPAAVDLAMGELRRGVMRRFASPGEPPGATAGLFKVVDTPTGRLTIDVFVHRDLYPGPGPRLAVYDTVPRGLVRFADDPAREHDRLKTSEEVLALPGGVAGAHLPAALTYTTMLKGACGRLGWDASSLRGFRLEVRFPVYGAQYMLALTKPAG